MKSITKRILQLVTCITIGATIFAGNAMALTIQEGAEAARADGMPAELIGADGVINKFTNIALYAVGLIAVFMLIWGGLRYILSGGDSKKITDAKNTILYAILGLIIAFFAYAIVNFVLNSISSNMSSSSSESSENKEDEKDKESNEHDENAYLTIDSYIQ